MNQFAVLDDRFVFYLRVIFESILIHQSLRTHSYSFPLSIRTGIDCENGREPMDFEKLELEVCLVASPATLDLTGVRDKN